VRWLHEINLDNWRDWKPIFEDDVGGVKLPGTLGEDQL